MRHHVFSKTAVGRSNFQTSMTWTRKVDDVSKSVNTSRTPI